MDGPFTNTIANKLNNSAFLYKIRIEIVNFFTDIENIQFSTTSKDIYYGRTLPYYEKLKEIEIERKKLSEIKKLTQKLITEASKKRILIDKVGFNEENAELLDRLCGPLSVWMGNKLIDYYKNYYGTLTNELTPQEFKVATINKINESNLIDSRKHQINAIMDWVRVGLNGNLGNNKELSFPELLNKSNEWHESLEIGQGDINYVEENSIILDYRDEDGFGFYWVNLETNDSSEECDRMGHCGRTHSSNTLYSLREVKPLNKKYTLNKSHLTAAIGDYDGILYQLKGPKNSKPKDELHKYILPLFYVLGGPGEEEDYLIRGFGSEYESQLDFKITDLPKESIIDLYKNRPELFNSLSMKYKLYDIGIIDENPINWSITLELSPDEVGNYVDGDWVVRKRKTEYGNIVPITLFEIILSGDAWDLWENYDEWKSPLYYNVDDENKERIHNFLIKKAKEDDVDVDGMDLEEMIMELDDNYEIRSAIISSNSDAEADDYFNYLYENLKSALEEWGNVRQMNDEGVIIDIDVSQFLSLDDEYNMELIDEFDGDVIDLFNESISRGYIEIPKFQVDDRWHPDVDEKYFNDILYDRLSEFMD
jgi:hypothetical protein